MFLSIEFRRKFSKLSLATPHSYMRNLKCLLCVAGLAFYSGCDQNQSVDLDSGPQKQGYALGRKIGEDFKRQELPIDRNALVVGINEALAGKESRLKPAEQQAALSDLQQAAIAAQMKTREQDQKVAEAQAGVNKKNGSDYLAQQVKDKGFTKTSSGLVYKAVKNGKGTKPKATDWVRVHYRGRLVDGTQFDSSYDRGSPAEFPVNGVIRGWTEALQLMAPGAQWELAIPSDLGYGDRGMPPDIPPGAVLVFEVELIKVAGSREELG